MTLKSTFELGTYYYDNEKKLFKPNFSWDICSYEMITGRNDDDRHPTTPSKVDYIEVELVSGIGLEYLAEWYLRDTKLLGRISVQLQPLHSSDDNMRVIEFADARCFSIVEEYVMDVSLRITTIKIAPGSVIVDGKTF